MRALLFNNKLGDNSTSLHHRISTARHLSKRDNINQSSKNNQNLSSNRIPKYENSQRFLTLQNEAKTNYETIFTLPSLEVQGEKSINTLHRTLTKPTIKRSKTSSNNSAIKLLSNKILYNPRYYNVSKSTFKFYNKHYKKKGKREPFKGVPKEFIEAMRLDVDHNIIKANKYMIEEKKRLIKGNSNLKYVFMTNQNNRKRKEEELKRAYEYELIKEQSKNSTKVKKGTNLNSYYKKLLLKENEQHFYIDRPMIDKNKFNKKYILYKNTDEVKKEHPNKNIRKIFSKIIYDKFYAEQKRKNMKSPREVLFKKFRASLKKSAIEFKKIIIPFKDYTENYYKSKSLTELLFKNEYPYLLQQINRQLRKKEKKEEKENEIIKFMIQNLSTLYIVDFYGQSVIMFIIKNKLYNCLSKSIQFGCNPDIQDFKGRTALYFAVMNKDLIAVVLLIYFLANPLLKDKNGKCPLDYLINKIIIEDKNNDLYIIKEVLERSCIIWKINKYRSWKEFEVCIRRGIQFFLINILSFEKYELIFSYIENPSMYYINEK